MRGSRRRLLRNLLAVAAVATVVSACGQKGGLYLPQDNPPEDASLNNKSQSETNGGGGKNKKAEKSASLAPQNLSP